jgi:superfamily II DNA or RNA helicase
MLRDYQKQAVSEFENSEQKNVCLQLPTGAGKTFTFCEIAKNHVAEHLQKVLILVHRTELMEQAKRSLGAKCFEIAKGVKTIPHTYDYYVGMVETTHRRLEKLPNFGLVIIDECHIGNFKKLPFFKDENVKVLGVTATPMSSNKIEPLSDYYNDLIMPVTIGKLIKENHLLNCEVYGFESEAVKNQNFKTKGGDFDEKQMQDFYSSEKLIKSVLEAYWTKIAGQKTIIFNVNCEHSNEVYFALKKEGLNVYVLDGQTPTNERKEILKKFKEQDDAILCNVGVLTTGFDEPSVKAIILNRATKSLPLYLQMIGRGSRLYEGKDKFTIIDLGLNTSRHGFYAQNFDWQTKFRLKGKVKEGAPPVKECPKCGFTMHISIRECPKCGYEFVSEKIEEKIKKFQELTISGHLEIPTEKLLEISETKGYKPYWVLYKIAEHLAKTINRFPDLLDEEWIEIKMREELKKWAQKNKKRVDEFNLNIIRDEIRKQNTK